MKHILIFIFALLIFSSCQKEYNLEIERIEVWRGSVKHLEKDIKRETIKAKNDREAAQKAYESYVINIFSFCNMEETNSEFLWIPVNYKLTDSDGKTISKNLSDFDVVSAEYMITDDYENKYYDWVGGFDYNGTPYGQRHPRKLRF